MRIEGFAEPTVHRSRSDVLFPSPSSISQYANARGRPELLVKSAAGYRAVDSARKSMSMKLGARISGPYIIRRRSVIPKQQQGIEGSFSISQDTHFHRFRKLLPPATTHVCRNSANEVLKHGSFVRLQCLTNHRTCVRIDRYSVFKVGLWRSWERASMAWKRSSVRSRPGPPIRPSGGFFLPWCFRFRMAPLGCGMLDLSINFPAHQKSKAGYVEPHHQDHHRAQ